MTGQQKQILRMAGTLILGLAIGSVVIDLFPRIVSEFVTNSVGAFVRGLVIIGEASPFALTLGLVAVSSSLLACCYLLEIGMLLYALRKIRRDESTDLAGQTLNAVGRISAPLSLGVLGGLVIATFAFEGHWNATFASYPWAGPATVLTLLVAAFVKTSLKRAVLGHLARTRPGQREGGG